MSTCTDYRVVAPRVGDWVHVLHNSAGRGTCLSRAAIVRMDEGVAALWFAVMLDGCESAMPTGSPYATRCTGACRS